MAGTGRGKNAPNEAYGVLRTDIEAAIKAGGAATAGYSLSRGLGDIVSAEGLIKFICGDKDRHPTRCSLAVLDEVGYKFEDWFNPKASGTHKKINSVLLSLYSSSGRSTPFDGLSYSDAVKNVRPSIAPAFSFIGNSTPEKLLATFEELNLAYGCIPRLLLFATTGSKEENTNPRFYEETPDPGLIELLVKLISKCSDVETKADTSALYEWIDVALDNEAQEL